jgi:hypothetical protein
MQDSLSIGLSTLAFFGAPVLYYRHGDEAEEYPPNQP